MLTLLRISGFALIDEVEVPLGPGLTAVTGETGAGKSVLVEAIALLRGGRASGEFIRAGCDEAQVEAIIEVPRDRDEHRRLEAEGREVAGGLVVRRVVSRAGRSRVHLGGALATAGELVATVGRLLDITSQHDQQSLMDPASQLAILDAFAENQNLCGAAEAAFAALAEAQRELDAFDADARTRAEREDLLKFQLAELEGAALEPGEDDLLRAERERVQGAERFLAATVRGEEALYSGEGAAAGRIAQVVRELEPLARLDTALAPHVADLRGAQATVEDVAAQLGRYAGGVHSDPERLAEIEDRLHLIARLCRKHGGTLAEVIARRERIAGELAQLGSFEDGIGARRAAVEAARLRLAGIADALSERRQKAARRLGRRIDATLSELGMPKAHLPIEVAPGEALGRDGRDRVRFLFAPNPGEAPRPLARIASGGELSRVMLAVKRALAHADQALTYVFDEVDAGVGGGMAEMIGRKLKDIAADRQVIVVTHMPQIAAFADRQIRVSKRGDQGRTMMALEVLDEAARAGEIARMLGGAHPSREAAAHADDLLRRARA